MPRLNSVALQCSSATPRNVRLYSTVTANPFFGPRNITNQDRITVNVGRSFNFNAIVILIIQPSQGSPTSRRASLTSSTGIRKFTFRVQGVKYTLQCNVV